jgi:hypothetical protein
MGGFIAGMTVFQQRRYDAYVAVMQETPVSSATA